jgi:hypothetical protein
MKNFFLKEADIDSIGGVKGNNNITIPFVYDSLDDTNFEPQFVRIRKTNTSTFFQGNVGDELVNNPSINVSLNGQSIFNGIKRLYMGKVVLDEKPIYNIRPGNSTLKFNYLGTDYTVSFKTWKVYTKDELVTYLNDTSKWVLDPPLAGFDFAVTSLPSMNDTAIEMTFSVSAVAVTVAMDTTSSFFTAGKAMWGGCPVTNPGSQILLTPSLLPAYYWDFKSTNLNKYNKNMNRASDNSTNNLYRYYFIGNEPDTSRYYANWNKESITNFDLSIVDDQGILVAGGGYAFTCPPFIAFELIAEQ